MGNLSAKVSNPHSPENLRKQEIKQAAGFILGTAAVAAVQLGAIFGSMAYTGSIKEAQETPTEEVSDKNTVIEETEDEIKEKVKNILTGNNVEINEEHSNDIVKKYKAMKAVNPNITDAEIARRLTNYARALKFHETELQAKKGAEVEFENECSKAKTQDELLAKYKQFGAEYVELYDEDGDGKINCYEMFFVELSEFYQTQGLNKTQAEIKAANLVKEYAKNHYNAMNMPTDNSSEALIFSEVVNKISVIDTAEGATTDTAISINEAAAHLMSMAQINDSKNNITKSEFNNTAFAIKYKDSKKEELIIEDGFDEKKAEEILQSVETYSKNMKLYMPTLNK